MQPVGPEVSWSTVAEFGQSKLCLPPLEISRLGCNLPVFYTDTIPNGMISECSR